MDGLRKLAAVTGRGVRNEAEAVLRRAVGSALAEVRQIGERIGPVYAAAKPFLEYASFLTKPESQIRVGDRVLLGSEWLPLAEKLSNYRDWCRRMGWPDKRAKAFLEAASKGELDLS